MGNQTFGAVLDRHLQDTGRTKVWLGKVVGESVGGKAIDAAVVSRWVTGEYNPPDPPVVFAIEACLELAPGTLSQLLGYLPLGVRDAVSVPAAVEVDPGLTAMGRRVVLKVYEEFVGDAADGS